MLYDRMHDAQAEIKATVSVNTGEQLSGNKDDDSASSADNKRKGMLYHNIDRVFHKCDATACTFNYFHIFCQLISGDFCLHNYCL